MNDWIETGDEASSISGRAFYRNQPYWEIESDDRELRVIPKPAAPWLTHMKLHAFLWIFGLGLIGAILWNHEEMRGGATVPALIVFGIWVAVSLSLEVMIWAIAWLEFRRGPYLIFDRTTNNIRIPRHDVAIPATEFVLEEVRKVYTADVSGQSELRGVYRSGDHAERVLILSMNQGNDIYDELTARFHKEAGVRVRRAKRQVDGSVDVEWLETP